MHALCVESAPILKCLKQQEKQLHNEGLIERDQLYVSCWTLFLEEFVINSCLVLVSLWDTGDNKILWHLNSNVLLLLPLLPKFGIHQSPPATS
jgi:hypothetical protein